MTNELKSTGNGKFVFEIFPEEYIALNRELATDYHPKLIPILAGIGMDDMDLKLAQIAAYCSVMLDAIYTLEERIKLCEILRKKLVELREDPTKPQTIVQLLH